MAIGPLMIDLDGLEVTPEERELLQYPLVGGVILFAIVALKAFGYIRPIFRTRGKINAEVTGRLTETLNGVRVIKGFNAEEQENKTFEAGVERLFLNVKKSLTATAAVTSSGTFSAPVPA